MIPSTIVDFYFRDRANADTTDEKRRVWRTYARAVIEEFQRPERRVHTIGAPVIIWRRSNSDENNWACPSPCGKTRVAKDVQPPEHLQCGECEKPLTVYTQGLASPSPPYWASLPLTDLQALWLALERARQPAPPLVQP